MKKHAKSWTVRRLQADGWRDEQDRVVVEEPLEIRLTFGREPRRLTRRVAVTMRTPGHDALLALGFLYSEGIISDKDEVESVGPGLSRLHRQNVIEVALKPEVTFDPARLNRNFYTTSSCGICGKASIEAVALARPCQVPHSAFHIDRAVLCRLPERLAEQQEVFRATGGLHAAALFDAQGRICEVYEDVGRHNALDKLIGAAFQRGALPLHAFGLVLSGRLGFELMQKAAMAGVPLVAAIGAPTSLALELASDTGITAAAFLRAHSCNLYTHPHRVKATGG